MLSEEMGSASDPREKGIIFSILEFRIEEVEFSLKLCHNVGKVFCVFVCQWRCVPKCYPVTLFIVCAYVFSHKSHNNG